jgi:hypothetical protein
VALSVRQSHERAADDRDEMSLQDLHLHVTVRATDLPAISGQALFGVCSLSCDCLPDHWILVTLRLARAVSVALHESCCGTKRVICFYTKI